MNTIIDLANTIFKPLIDLGLCSFNDYCFNTDCPLF